MRTCAETLAPEMTDDEQVFLENLIKENHFCGNHLEIGTAAGGSLCLMLKCFTRESTPQFIVVDRMNYFEHQYRTVLDNIRNNQIDTGRVRFIISSSRDAYKKAKKERLQFDFALVDAGHKALAVMSDCRWSSMINVGGIICFHDYADRCPGVCWAVDRFMERNRNYSIYGHVDSLIAIKKNAKDNVTNTVTFLDQLQALYMQLKHRKRKH